MLTTGGAQRTDAVSNMGDADSVGRDSPISTTSTNSVGATCRSTKAGRVTCHVLDNGRGLCIRDSGCRRHILHNGSGLYLLHNNRRSLQDGCCDEHEWCGYCRKKRSDLGHLQNFRLCHLAERCSAQTLGGLERRVPCRTRVVRIRRAEALRSPPPPQFQPVPPGGQVQNPKLSGV